MAPPGAKHFTKGGHDGHPQIPTDAETFTQEPVTTTIKEMITTVMNSISSTVQDTLVPGGADSSSNNTFPGEGGADEMSSSNNTDVARMNDNSSETMMTSTGTSFDLITTTLMDGMHMEHTDDAEEYNVVLFIVLGVVLGILIVAALVLGVVYNHYKKRGFQEIAGDHGQVDPQSMKQLQQASSQDALLDK